MQRNINFPHGETRRKSFSMAKHGNLTIQEDKLGYARPRFEEGVFDKSESSNVNWDRDSRQLQSFVVH